MIERRTPLLEVSIPTYRRPRKAIAAISSVVGLHDQRVLARCRSNRPEPVLENHCRTVSGVEYSNSSENLGIRGNLRYLLSHAKGEWVMLLSDEDEISTAHIQRVIECLQSLPDDVALVLTAIEEKGSGSLKFRPNVFLADRLLDAQTFYALGPFTTYISGLIFRRTRLEELSTDFQEIFQDHPGNVYSQVDLMEKAVSGKRFLLLSTPLVIAGPDAGYGGEAYGHTVISNSNPGQNPQIYGPSARVLQFFYRKNPIFRSGRKESRLVRLLSVLRHLAISQRRVREARSVAGHLGIEEWRAGVAKGLFQATQLGTGLVSPSTRYFERWATSLSESRTVTEAFIRFAGRALAFFFLLKVVVSRPIHLDEIVAD